MRRRTYEELIPDRVRRRSPRRFSSSWRGTSTSISTAASRCFDQSMKTPFHKVNAHRARRNYMQNDQQSMAMIEQNTCKRRGIGLRAYNPERAYPGFTLFAPHFEQNKIVYLIDLRGEVVHTWRMPYPPGMS